MNTDFVSPDSINTVNTTNATHRHNEKKDEKKDPVVKTALNQMKNLETDPINSVMDCEFDIIDIQENTDDFFSEFSDVFEDNTNLKNNLIEDKNLTNKNIEDIQKSRNDARSNLCNNALKIVNVTAKGVLIVDWMRPDDMRDFQDIQNKFANKHKYTLADQHVSSHDISSVIGKMAKLNDAGEVVVSEELLMQHPHILKAVMKGDLDKSLRDKINDLGVDDFPQDLKMVDVKKMSKEDKDHLESLVKKYIILSHNYVVLNNANIVLQEAKPEKSISKHSEETANLHKKTHVNKLHKKEVKNKENNEGGADSISQAKSKESTAKNIIRVSQRLKLAKKAYAKKEEALKEEKSKEIHHKQIRKDDDEYFRRKSENLGR